MGVLRVVMVLGNRVKETQIASWLDVAPSVVENVIFDPVKAFFTLDIVNDVDFSTSSFKDFLNLLDASRAREYFISSDYPDAFSKFQQPSSTL